MSKIFKALTEGISSQELADVLFSRLIYRFPDVVSKYGHEYLGDIIADVASFHEGAEELGSSDINIMIREIMNKLKQLDETTTQDADEIVSYGLYTSDKQEPLMKFNDIESLKNSYSMLKKKYPNYDFIAKKTVTTTTTIDHPSMLEGHDTQNNSSTKFAPKESAIMKGLQN